MTDRIKIKPLVWRGPFPANGYKNGRWMAEEYAVVRKGQDCWRVYRNLVDEKDAIYNTSDAAKAAAQADYVRRARDAVVIFAPTINVDALAQIIRTADGDHSMGAGELAEAIAARIAEALE